MANEKRLIDANTAIKEMNAVDIHFWEDAEDGVEKCVNILHNAPTVDAYTAHEVAEILAEVFGDTCACNFNGNDEWLPDHCEVQSACPHPVGVACWEQYLKFRGERRTDNG